MASRWTSPAALIFQTALFHLSSPTSESNLSFLQIHSFRRTKHINLFLNLFSSNNPAHRYYLSSDPVTGQLYISDTNSRRIYRPRMLSGEVEPQANVEVVAGTGDHCLPFDENQCGDGGPASEALLTGPKGTNKTKRYSADPDHTQSNLTTPILSFWFYSQVPHCNQILQGGTVTLSPDLQGDPRNQTLLLTPKSLVLGGHHKILQTRTARNATGSIDAQPIADFHYNSQNY